MTSKNIAIIGAGNMGASLLGGLLNHGYSPDTIWISDTSSERLQTLQQQLSASFHITTDNEEAAKHADIIILAVKPQILANVVRALSKCLQRNKPLVISVAAGVLATTIEQWGQGNIAIVRAMPNTPASIGYGATGLFANLNVTDEQRIVAEGILNAVGITVWVSDEKTLDVVTALSGSGPAYFFLVIEALQQAGEQLGLTKEAARLLTLQTAYGATRMAKESDENVITLRKNVTSPGGTTEQSIRVLEENHIRQLFVDALKAAEHRAKEISILLEKDNTGL